MKILVVARSAEGYDEAILSNMGRDCFASLAMTGILLAMATAVAEPAENTIITIKVQLIIFQSSAINKAEYAPLWNDIRRTCS